MGEPRRWGGCHLLRLSSACIRSEGRKEGFKKDIEGRLSEIRVRTPELLPPKLTLPLPSLQWFCL